MSLSHVVIEEVAPGTGWSGVNRWADVLALSVWPSKGLTLDGYEIKASRADLKRELADPKKHEALARYCDTWTLVVWDEAILLEGIPETWGICTTSEEDGERVLLEKRRPTKLEATSWPRGFVCSLVRNAYEQAPGAAYLARAVAAAYKKGVRDAEYTADHERTRLVEPLAKALYGRDRYKWPSEAHDAEKICLAAAESLMKVAP